jgi:hypothetical protein
MEAGKEAAGFLLDGGNLTYDFANAIKIPFIFRKKGRIL